MESGHFPPEPLPGAFCICCFTMSSGDGFFIGAACDPDSEVEDVVEGATGTAVASCAGLEQAVTLVIPNAATRLHAILRLTDLCIVLCTSPFAPVARLGAKIHLFCRVLSVPGIGGVFKPCRKCVRQGNGFPVRQGFHSCRSRFYSYPSGLGACSSSRSRCFWPSCSYSASRFRRCGPDRP